MGGKPKAKRFSKGMHLHFDGVAGVAGDMSLGAFVDCGVPLKVLNQAIEKVGLGPGRLLAKTAMRRGISCVDVVVRMNDGSTSRDPYDDNAHKHHPYRDIVKRIKTSELKVGVKSRALDIFRRLGKAEALVHKTRLEDVAFHEVGAVDAICDVVGASAALDYISPCSVSSSVVSVGSGGVKTSHGLIPVPSPAALSILGEVNGLIRSGGAAMELCTPTGAAILAHAVEHWGDSPPMTPVSSGYGCGDKDLKDRPNVFRVTLGKPQQNAKEEDVILIEANIDDMTSEQCGYVMERVFEHGALDGWWTALVMKKGRPGWKLSVLTNSLLLPKVRDVIFRETSTIGFRHMPFTRVVLDRKIVKIDTAHGVIRAKVASCPDTGEVLQVSPEYEDVKRIAMSSGKTFSTVYQLALKKDHDRG